MKSLLIPCVLLCVALCVRSAPKDVTAVTEEQEETGRQGPFGFCPRDWIEHGSSCYYLITGESTWTRAEADCIYEGATLVSVESLWEMEWLHEEFLTVANGLQMWTGGYYFQGRWGWVDGNRFDMAAPIADPMADPSYCPTDCASLSFYAGGMVRVPCSQTYPAICKRPSSSCKK